MSNPSRDPAPEKGLPANLDAERFTLGSILLNGEAIKSVYGYLEDADFSIESHRRIYLRMIDLHLRGDRIDRVTVANELIRAAQLESIGGLTYLVSLDDGLPQVANLESYVKIIKEKSALRRLIFAAKKTIENALVELSSPDEIASYAISDIQSISSWQLKEEGRSPQKIVEDYPGGIGAFLDPTLRTRGIQTGFRKLDEMTSGMYPGQLIMLAARPSMGKTALMMGILENIFLNRKKPEPAAVFSLETTGESLITRSLCSRASMDHQKFRAGYVNKDERRRIQVALSDIMDSPLTIFDEFGITVPEIGRNIRRLVDKKGIKIAAIDYLQLISVPGKENRNNEIGFVTRYLKVLAKECGIPILLLSQLSRASEKRQGSKRPILSDLRDSGSIEADSDCVWFVHREEVYAGKDRDDLKGLAELIIAKQRDGPCGIVDLRFFGNFVKFADPDGDIDYSPAEEPQAQDTHSIPEENADW